VLIFAAAILGRTGLSLPAERCRAGRRRRSTDASNSAFDTLTRTYVRCFDRATVLAGYLQWKNPCEKHAEQVGPSPCNVDEIGFTAHSVKGVHDRMAQVGGDFVDHARGAAACFFVSFMRLTKLAPNDPELKKDLAECEGEIKKLGP